MVRRTVVIRAKALKVSHVDSFTLDNINLMYKTTNTCDEAYKGKAAEAIVCGHLTCDMPNLDPTGAKTQGSSS